ncbi:MAG: hypothetical protein ABI882_22725 [Acidobacteriota bacterium]
MRAKRQRALRSRKVIGGHGREHGFALVALLAGLTIMLVMMAAAIPAIKHDLQREQEEEMFWRGQQVARALARFAVETGRYPTTLDELTKTFPNRQGQTLRLLRPTALTDPLGPPVEEETTTALSSLNQKSISNWRPVRAGDPLINEFYQAYLAEMMKNPERRLPPAPQQLAQLAQLTGANVGGLNSNGMQGGPSTSEFSSQLKVNEGPIFGVVSKDTRPLIRNYLEIASYDHALFFAGVAVSMPGIYNPIIFAPPATASGGAQGRQNDPRCPNGGVYFEQNGKGFCGGVLNPGRLCRGPDGSTIPCPDAPK